MNRKGVDQLAFNEAQTNLKDRQITAIFTIDQMSATFMNGASAGGHRPNIQQHHGQGQTGEAIVMVQQGAFQIKAMSFKIAKHLFNGLITNDKFCMMRTGQLRLNHWRRPMRLRTTPTEKKGYSASEKSECGGSYETPVEDSSGSARVPERTEPMGSSISLGTGDCSRCRKEADTDDQPGGAV
jgi:hypothetical protein